LKDLLGKWGRLSHGEKKYCVENGLEKIGSSSLIPFVGPVITAYEAYQAYQHVKKCLKVFRLGLHAIDVTSALIDQGTLSTATPGANSPDDLGSANAFKHSLWIGLLTFEMGADDAWFFGRLHEDHPEHLDSQMDLHNDRVGIHVAWSLGNRGRGTEGALETALLAAVGGEEVFGRRLAVLNGQSNPTALIYLGMGPR
jgi:hypothetical protein